MSKLLKMRDNSFYHNNSFVVWINEFANFKIIAVSIFFFIEKRLRKSFGKIVKNTFEILFGVI
jgi:hypothetical protein